MNKYWYKTYLSIHISFLLYIKSKKLQKFKKKKFLLANQRWVIFDPIGLKGLRDLTCSSSGKFWQIQSLTSSNMAIFWSYPIMIFWCAAWFVQVIKIMNCLCIDHYFDLRPVAYISSCNICTNKSHEGLSLILLARLFVHPFSICTYIPTYFKGSSVQ